MSVYVDKIMPCEPNKNWKYNHSCHLIADTVAELHSFAASLGLKESWFQSKTIPHYDLTRNKRREAVTLGAKEIDFASARRFIKLFRQRLGD